MMKENWERKLFYLLTPALMGDTCMFDTCLFGTSPLGIGCATAAACGDFVSGRGKSSSELVNCRLDPFLA
jgi:hypothetical protein